MWFKIKLPVFIIIFLLKVGQGIGKPGRPYEVTVCLKGFFAEKDQTFIDVAETKFKLGDESIPYRL